MCVCITLTKCWFLKRSSHFIEPIYNFPDFFFLLIFFDFSFFCLRINRKINHRQRTLLHPKFYGVVIWTTDNMQCVLHFCLLFLQFIGLFVLYIGFFVVTKSHCKEYLKIVKAHGAFNLLFFLNSYTICIPTAVIHSILLGSL